MSNIVTMPGKFIFYVLLVVAGIALLDFYWFDIIDWLKGLF